MAVIAVAGGTGNVGRTIVEAILAAGKHEVKILSRKSNPDLEEKLGVPIIAVDYSDVAGITRTLEENNIHTVISTNTTFLMDGSSPHEIQLIQAADASKTTKRIISNDWGAPHTDEHAKLFPSAAFKRQAQEELRKTTDLETTVVHCGCFLDYYDNFASRAVKSYLSPMVFVVDIAGEVAGIPGTGDVPVTFTHTTDVAKVVAASLDLEKWDPVSYISGDSVSWNEFLQLAEAAKGSKFNVTYDSIETLNSGKITELPSHVAMYPHFPKEPLQGLLATFGLWFEDGVFNLNGKTTLDAQLPEIQLLKVKDLLEKAWKKQ